MRSPPPPPRLTLDALLPGEFGIVDALDGEGPIVQRLRDLGLVPGTPVQVLRRAPLGDPTEYELRGYRLCLRETEARRVLVRRQPVARALSTESAA
ncbi:MAG TPA: FeoA family protein [Myxococcota bacterium]|nr:FeoA family protein [Myxococcota bacterium]